MLDPLFAVSSTGRCNAILNQGGRCYETKNAHLLHARTESDYLERQARLRMLIDGEHIIFQKLNGPIFLILHEIVRAAKVALCELLLYECFYGVNY